MTRPLLASISDAHDKLANKAAATAAEWTALAVAAEHAVVAIASDIDTLCRIAAECDRRATTAALDAENGTAK